MGTNASELAPVSGGSAVPPWAAFCWPADALARGTSASQLGVHATAAIWHGLADDSQLGRLARFARGLFLLPLRASSRRFHADDCAMGN